jgi:hypothetical protein
LRCRFCGRTEQTSDLLFALGGTWRAGISGDFAQRQIALARIPHMGYLQFVNADSLIFQFIDGKLFINGIKTKSIFSMSTLERFCGRPDYFNNPLFVWSKLGIEARVRHRAVDRLEHVAFCFNPLATTMDAKTFECAFTGKLTLGSVIISKTSGYETIHDLVATGFRYLYSNSTNELISWHRLTVFNVSVSECGSIDKVYADKYALSERLTLPFTVGRRDPVH